jgi:hypothetical protein
MANNINSCPLGSRNHQMGQYVLPAHRSPILLARVVSVSREGDREGGVARETIGTGDCETDMEQT